MKKFLTIMLIFFSFVGVRNVMAQGETAVPFLLLAPDSRAGGMGESGAGLADNSAAIFWNPAGIAFLKGSEVSITHSNWLPQFHLNDLFYDYLSYRQYIPDLGGSISASITYMNFGEFVRTLSIPPHRWELSAPSMRRLRWVIRRKFPTAGDWVLISELFTVAFRINRRKTKKDEALPLP